MFRVGFAKKREASAVAEPRSVLAAPTPTSKAKVSSTTVGDVIVATTPVFLETDILGQGSPNYLAPGTSYMKDNFSTASGAVDGSGGTASDGERQMTRRSPAANLLLCDPAPNRPRTGTGTRPGCWGPLS